jgi:hypothetical protein
MLHACRVRGKKSLFRCLGAFQAETGETLTIPYQSLTQFFHLDGHGLLVFYLAFVIAAVHSSRKVDCAKPEATSTIETKKTQDYVQQSNQTYGQIRHPVRLPDKHPEPGSNTPLVS